MNKYKLTNEYRGDLSLDGVMERFVDEICDKLNCGLVDEMIIEADHIEQVYHGILSMEDGKELDVKIYYDEEWICICQEQ